MAIIVSPGRAGGHQAERWRRAVAVTNEWMVGWLAVLTAAAPAFFAYLSKRSEQRWAERDASSSAAGALVNQLQEEVASLRASRQEDATMIKQLMLSQFQVERRIMHYEYGTQLLISQISNLGHTPAWTPDPEAPIDPSMLD